jgi:hypothetical protein
METFGLKWPVPREIIRRDALEDLKGERFLSLLQLAQSEGLLSEPASVTSMAVGRR